MSQFPNEPFLPDGSVNRDYVQPEGQAAHPTSTMSEAEAAQWFESDKAQKEAAIAQAQPAAVVPTPDAAATGEAQPQARQRFASRNTPPVEAAVEAVAPTE